jgi:hypothetical protein
MVVAIGMARAESDKGIAVMTITRSFSKAIWLES